jgi:hypothetical protein
VVEKASLPRVEDRVVVVSSRVLLLTLVVVIFGGGTTFFFQSFDLLFKVVT